MTSLKIVPVGETGIWMGCGHDADRFVIVLSGWALRHQLGPNTEAAA